VRVVAFTHPFQAVRLSSTEPDSTELIGWIFVERAMSATVTFLDRERANGHRDERDGHDGHDGH
jgi:hypothetical protein